MENTLDKSRFKQKIAKESRVVMVVVMAQENQMKNTQEE
jgi:hypothetical protein